MDYLFKKYPNATSGQLTWAKSRAVFAPALTTIGVKQLSLEKYILYNNVELGKAVSQSAQEHKDISYEQIVLEGWKYEPPKALSDVMESICGAMLVDSGYDFERTRGIIERVMEPLLRVLQTNLPRDPTSELMLSLARKSCQQAKFEYVVHFVLKYTERTTAHSENSQVKLGRNSKTMQYGFWFTGSP
jgi:endoribonuclease Dicer